VPRERAGRPDRHGQNQGPRTHRLFLPRWGSPFTLLAGVPDRVCLRATRRGRCHAIFVHGSLTETAATASIRVSSILPSNSTIRRVESTMVRKKLGRGRKNRCRFCTKEGCPRPAFVDYKDVQGLKKMCTSQGKLFSRKRSGNCAAFQRAVKDAVKRARFMA